MTLFLRSGKQVSVSASIPTPFFDPDEAARFVELMVAAEVPGVAKVSDLAYWRHFTEPPIIWLTDDADLAEVQRGVAQVMVEMGYSRVIENPCGACGGSLREREGDMLTECADPACGITHDEVGKPIPVVRPAR